MTEMFKSLRSDNENMVKELKRLETLNKTLRDKVLKCKSKMVEQDGVIKGLQSAMVLVNENYSLTRSISGTGLPTGTIATTIPTARGQHQETLKSL